MNASKYTALTTVLANQKNANLNAALARSNKELANSVANNDRAWKRKLHDRVLTAAAFGIDVQSADARWSAAAVKGTPAYMFSIHRSQGSNLDDARSDTIGMVLGYSRESMMRVQLSHGPASQYPGERWGASEIGEASTYLTPLQVLDPGIWEASLRAAKEVLGRLASLGQTTLVTVNGLVAEPHQVKTMYKFAVGILAAYDQLKKDMMANPAPATDAALSAAATALVQAYKARIADLKRTTATNASIYRNDELEADGVAGMDAADFAFDADFELGGWDNEGDGQAGGGRRRSRQPAKHKHKHKHSSSNATHVHSNGHAYTVRTGAKGGKYILVSGSKVYIKA